MSADSQNDDDPTKLEEFTPQEVRLTGLEKKNLALLVLAFSCVIACNTLVVGTGAKVVLSVGGSTSLAPFALAILFMGMSMVSLAVTPWLFAQWGRKKGFWVGCVFGVIGSFMGGLGLFQTSPAIVLVAEFLLGAGAGIGMYLRFAALEVVPTSYSPKAVAWVLAGGCLAAFIGPETSQATTGELGDDDNLEYLGSFVVSGGFFALQAIFVGFVQFPAPTEIQTPPPEQDEAGETPMLVESDEENAGGPESSDGATPPDETSEVLSLIQSRAFLIPLVASIVSWAVMAMPMSIFRVTMGELGFSDRQSLTVIEIHFLSMYGPGFWTGNFIKKYGVVRACQVAILCLSLGLGINLVTPDNNNSAASWYFGLMFLGIGWNFGFSSATVWSTKAYENKMYLKPKLQAANECLIFFFSGGMIFSTGYLYDNAGGSGIEGWRLLNGILFALVGFFMLAVMAAMRDYQPTKASSPPSTEKEPEVVTE